MFSLLCLEGLKNRGQIQGIQIGNQGLILTHLLFADDALLFAKASLGDVYQLVNILNQYSLASGKKINASKSSLICGRFVNPLLKHDMARILHMSLWDNIGKYLGLPGEWGRAKNSAFAWLRERILAKLEGWKENILNQAGK